LHASHFHGLKIIDPAIPNDLFKSLISLKTMCCWILWHWNSFTF